MGKCPVYFAFQFDFGLAIASCFRSPVVIIVIRDVVTKCTNWIINWSREKMAGLRKKRVRSLELTNQLKYVSKGLWQDL